MNRRFLVPLGALPLLVGCALESSGQAPSIDPLAPDPDAVFDESSPSADLDPEQSSQALSSGPACGGYHALSPSGLTLVIDLSFADDIEAIKPYVRPRDILMTGGSHTDEVHRKFPCNRLVQLLSAKDRDQIGNIDKPIGGILLDHEPYGYSNWSWSLSWGIEVVHDFVRAVHEKTNAKAGVVPIFTNDWNYATLAKQSNVDYQLVQIQPACKSGPSAFAAVAHHVLSDYRAASVPIRSVGFEVSMKPGGDHAVGGGTAAECTKRAWKKGARAIFVYGLTGHSSNWMSYFRSLDELGLREKRDPLTLEAKLVKKWSNAKRYRGKGAHYIVCAGKPFELGFTFKNTGSARWRDVDGRGDKLGSDVFLVTASGKRDKLTGRRRYSVRMNENSSVRGDRKAKNCSTEDGCRKTTFIKGGMRATAPNEPGVYTTRWRLRDYSKLWGETSKGFGPKVELKFKVKSCETTACGCTVCTGGSAGAEQGGGEPLEDDPIGYAASDDSEPELDDPEFADEDAFDGDEQSISTSEVAGGEPAGCSVSGRADSTGAGLGVLLALTLLRVLQRTARARS